MADINPLSLMTGSPLAEAARGKGSDQLAQLERSLSSINLQGANQRANTGLANAGALARTGLPLGLDPSGPSFTKDLGQLRDLLRAGQGADIGATLQRGAFGIQAPGTARTPAEIGVAPFKGGADLPGASAAKAAGKVTAEQEATEKLKDVIGPKGGQVGTLTQRERTTGAKLKGEAKKVSPQDAQVIINSVKNKLGVDITEGNITGDTPTHFIVEVGNKTYRLKKR